MAYPLRLASAALVLVLLTFAVGVRLLMVRTREMRDKRVHPQAASNHCTYNRVMHRFAAFGTSFLLLVVLWVLLVLGVAGKAAI